MSTEALQECIKFAKTAAVSLNHVNSRKHCRLYWSVKAIHLTVFLIVHLYYIRWLDIYSTTSLHRIFLYAATYSVIRRIVIYSATMLCLIIVLTILSEIVAIFKHDSSVIQHILNSSIEFSAGCLGSTLYWVNGYRSTIIYISVTLQHAFFIIVEAQAIRTIDMFY